MKTLNRCGNKSSKKPRRFLLFAGDRFHPWGGWGDFQDSFDDLDKARGEAGQLKKDHHGDFWFEIIDLETGEGFYELQD